MTPTEAETGSPTPISRATLLGCGDLGTRIALRLAEAGHRVTGVRRRADLVPAPVVGLSLDLLEGDLPPIPTDLLVVCLTADERDEAGYRRTYVEAMGNGLRAVLAAGRPTAAVLVSSTGVFGDGEGLLDESAPPRPARATSRVLLEAEEAFHAALPHGVVARLSGLYGAPGNRLVRAARAAEPPRDPATWTNRIHREDAAAAVVHLLDLTDPPPLVTVTDDEPSLAGEVFDFIAAEVGSPVRTGVSDARHGEGRGDGPGSGHGKRLSNALLRGTGFVPSYPTYREGYRAQVALDGR